MPLTGERTLVNFGFGAIGAGLFLYEACESGNFGRLVVAEVVPEVIETLRAAGGFCSVNIARADRVEAARVGPVEVYNPNVAEDRGKLIAAISNAEEIATAVPSVDCYALQREGSLHRVLAAGLNLKVQSGGPRAVVYAAENHNRAAEILEEQVLAEVSADARQAVRARVGFLNTVIGKMSGLAADPGRGGLAPVAPGSGRAFLVEEFNRILVSAPRFDAPFERGLAVFEERGDLLPFEEAKLFGHNAAHALAGYLGAQLGVGKIADLREVAGFMAFLREAFIEESGEALVKKHAGVDRLFTPAGYAAYAADLLARMTNPHLGDTVERVARDPHRKLGWDDRLIGTVRLALGQGILPRRFALGAAASFAFLDAGAVEEPARLEMLARSLWESASPEAGEIEAVLEILEAGRGALLTWKEAGFPELPAFLVVQRELDL